MTHNLKKKSEAETLRQKAEETLITNKVSQVSQLPEGDMLKLIHELQVHQIELRMQNETLQEAKELADAATKKFTTLYDSAPTGYFTLSNDGKIIELNPAGAKMLGKERSYLKNKQLGIFITSENRPVFNQFLNAVFESKTIQTCEIALLSDESISTDVYLTGLVVENSEFCLLNGVDITERKKTEEALLENNSRLNLAMQAANMAWWEMDINTGCVTFGEKKAEMLGFPLGKFIHYSDFTKLIHPDDHDKAMNAMYAHIHGASENYEVEYRILTQSGDYKWFYDKGTIVKQSTEGAPLRVTGLVFDITARKQVEEELQQSEERYRLVLQNSMDAILLAEPGGTIFSANPAACEMFQRSEEEICQLGRNELVDITDPRVDILLEERKRTGKGSGEITLIRKDGSKLPAEISSSVFLDHNNEQKVSLIIRDISERKLAEYTIKRSETILKLFIEHSPAAIAMFDSDMKYISASQRYLVDYDLSGQNLIGRSHYEIFPEIPERWKDIHNRCLSGITERCNEDPFVRSNGKLDWIRWEICPWFEADGKIGGIILFSEVITESKIAEQYLKKSEEIWHKLVTTSPEFISILDLEGNYLYLNHFAEGFSEKDISGKKAVDFIADKSKSTFLIRFEKCRRTQQTQQFEYEALGDNGTISIYEGYLAPILEQAKVVSIMSIAKDISERRLADEKLSASEVRYRRLFESSKDGILILDADTGTIVDVNPFLVAMLSYSHDVLLGKNIWEIGSFKDIIKNKANFLELQQKEYIRYEDLPLETSGGQTIHVEFISNVYHVDNKKVIQCNIRDISERKIAEQEIRKSKEQLALLYKHLSEVREEERTSIAREIHDDLGQSLAGLKIDLLVIKEDILDKICQPQKINKAISLVETTIKTVQKLSSQLRPQMLNELGLASAIEWQSGEFIKRTGIKCKLELEEIEDLAENIAISLFRIFQASLTNIMLHAKAKSVSVKLELKEEIIYLSVVDDGIGITHEQLNSSKSFGIIGMRERASQIKGNFNIHTKVNVGTEIIVAVPLIRHQASGNRR